MRVGRDILLLANYANTLSEGIMSTIKAQNVERILLGELLMAPIGIIHVFAVIASASACLIHFCGPPLVIATSLCPKYYLFLLGTSHCLACSDSH